MRRRTIPNLRAPIRRRRISIRATVLIVAFFAALPAGLAGISSLSERMARPAVIQNTIDARRGYKQFVLHNAGGLFVMARGERDYDPELAADLALNLKGLTNLRTRSLWLEGTDSESNPGMTRALPTNWSDPEILDHHAAFRMASADLAKVAGNGLSALRSGVVALETACRSCHARFRARDF